MATLSSVTWKEIEGQVRSLSGATSYANPNSDTMRRWGNMVLHKIARLLTGIDKPWGRNTVTLTALNATGQTYDGGDGLSYTASTNTFAGASGLDQTYVGGIAIWQDTPNARAFYGIIDTVNAAGTSCVIRNPVGTGAEADVAAADIDAHFKPNPWFYNGANLSGSSVLDLIKIVDGTNGNAVRLDSDAFATFSSNPNYDSSIVTEFAGEAVYFDKGSSISSFGTLTATFDEKPDTISSATTSIDLLPEHLSMFTEELVRWTLNFLQKPVPNEYEDPLAVLKEQYKKHAEDTAQRLSNKYIPARRQ